MTNAPSLGHCFKALAERNELAGQSWSSSSSVTLVLGVSASGSVEAGGIRNQCS